MSRKWLTPEEICRFRALRQAKALNLGNVCTFDKEKESRKAAGGEHLREYQLLGLLVTKITSAVKAFCLTFISIIRRRSL